MRTLIGMAAFSLVAGALGATGHTLTKPDVHGNLVVFTCEGDLWLGDITTGDARRITSDPGNETNAHFSPDGTKIAFTANYDGGTDVYVMPSGGGAPVRLTYDSKSAEVVDWSPDGAQVLFRSRRQQPVGYNNRLWSVPATGGIASLYPVPSAEFAAMGPKLLAYVPTSSEWMNWFGYRAGAADEIWLYDPTTKQFRRGTNDPAVDTAPVWSGSRLFFISARTGIANLYELGIGDGKAKPITSFDDRPVRYPGADAAHVVFEHGPRLGIYDVASGKASDLEFRLGSDEIRTRETRFPLARFAGSPAIGPSGKRILLAARGQIVSVASENGDLRVLEKTPGARAVLPAWSNDGKKFAFVSDRSGENELWIGDAAGGQPARQLTTGLAANPFAPTWSPDGKSIVIVDRDAKIRLIDATTGAIKVVDQSEAVGSYDSFAAQVSYSPDAKLLVYTRADSRWIVSTYLYDIATGRKELISHPSINTSAPAFSADGKFAIFLADTSLTPNDVPVNHKYAFDNATRPYMVALAADTESPFLPKNDEEGPAPAPAMPAAAPAPVSKVDWDGLAERIIEVPVAPGRYQNVLHVPGKLLLLNLTSIPFIDGSPAGLGELLSYDIEKRTTTRVAAADSMQKSLDGKKLLLQSGPSFSVIDASSGPTTAAPVSLASYTLTVDPVQEWRQEFNETWRIARDFFYDPTMHGVDWPKMRTKYEARLATVGDRADLTRMLKDLLSELRSGHAYVIDTPPSTTRIPMGYLGADFVLDRSGDAPALRITKLYRGDGFSGGRSPLLDPGTRLKEGDFILAIGGQPIPINRDPQSLLVGLANQTVALAVNDKPSLTGSRVVRVKTLTSDDSLRYADWVVGRSKYVEDHAGPTFGYLHVSDMTAKGLIGFTKGQFPNVMKEAMVYDTRFNGGGYISSLLLENIAAKPQAWWSPRYGSFWTRENWANVGYAAAICNEDNFSDGELFIEVWKRMKLGPVVGKRTGGGEVGSGGGYDLADGGRIFIPNYAAFADGKWLIEGIGATPDIEVDQDPAAVMAGRDPQLDKAIELLKAKLAKQPIVHPVRPPYKKVVG